MRRFGPVVHRADAHLCRPHEETPHRARNRCRATIATHAPRPSTDAVNRRALLVLGALVAASKSFRVSAQAPARTVRIGYLAAGGDAEAPFLEALRRGLREAGWIEGSNLAIEVRLAHGDYARLADLASGLVQQRVDLIFASSTPAAAAAKAATAEIPIVIGRVADPVGSGLVASLARPGRNITGWTHQGLEMRVKYLDFIKEAVPQAVRVGVLWNPKNPVHAPALKSIEATARSLKVALHPAAVSDASQLTRAFEGFAADRVQALVVFQDGLLLTQGARIIEMAARQRLPTIYSTEEMVRAGGLMSYGADLRTMYQQGAVQIDRILKGARPAELPIQQPTKFELVINARTARTLGLELPRSLLLRADEVVE
jgi:putative ABC transport system substrate-binding protein